VAAVATATAASPLEKAAREQATAAAPKAEAKKLSMAQRVVAKALVKKLQKAEKKFDIKKEKARKAGKADPTVRTGIIIAVVGLAILLVGAIISSGLLYGLGGVGITVGLVIILLAALDVI
jgi:Flp pilus assembly protein TadB